MCTGTPIMCTGTCGGLLIKRGFLIQNLAPFDIPNSPPLSTSQALTFCVLSHKPSRVRLFLPGFHSLRPGFSCSLRTDVVSLLNFIESILCYLQLYMDLFGLFWLVVSCTWWFTVSVKGMGRKVLSDLHRASPVFF